MIVLNASYKTLVDVVIRHDYYRLPTLQPAGSAKPPEAVWPPAFDIHRDLEIYPSQECARMLDNARIKFRTTPTGFQLVIQSEEKDDKYISFIPIREDVKWTFFMRLRNPFWVNFTNQRIQETKPFTEAKDNIWYFSNLTGTNDNNALFLSQSLPNYSKNSDYLPGDMILDPDNNIVHEAIEKIENSPDDIDANKWYNTKFPSVHFANPKDRIPAQDMIFQYKRDNTVLPLVYRCHSKIEILAQVFKGCSERAHSFNREP